MLDIGSDHPVFEATFDDPAVAVVIDPANVAHRSVFDHARQEFVADVDHHPENGRHHPDPHAGEIDTAPPVDDVADAGFRDESVAQLRAAQHYRERKEVRLGAKMLGGLHHQLVHLAVESGMSALAHQRKDIDPPGPGGIQQVHHRGGGAAPGQAESVSVLQALRKMLGSRAGHGAKAQGDRAARVRDDRDVFDPGLLDQCGSQLRAGIGGIDDLESHDPRLARVLQVMGNQRTRDPEAVGNLLLGKVLLVIETCDLDQGGLLGGVDG